MPSNESKAAQAGLPVPNSTASFWHSEPSAFLYNHCTTSNLPSTADIVIIGSGITGASVARFLAEDARAANKSIVMLEARQACWGATGRNGGHCQPLLFARSPDVAAFEVRNVAEVKSYIEENDVSCEWRQVTACQTFWSEALLKEAEADISALKEADPELAKLVQITKDKAELKKYRVKPEAVGATLTQGAGCLWPYKYVTFILEKLVRDGKLNLQTNTPVTSMEPISFLEHVDSGKALQPRMTLHTPRGTVHATHVILATNGYTSHLLPKFAPLIVPTRCEMSALIPPRNSERLPSSYGFVGAHEQNPNYDDYLIQRPFYEDINGLRKGGHLMFGGGRGAAQDKCVGVWEDDVIDQGEAAYLRRGLLDTLELGGDIEKSGQDELRASHQWTGIKGYSRDNVPWVGKVPSSDGVWLAGGYTGHGMPNATLCGRAVVEMLLATAEGTPLATIQQKLVAAGDLPESYLISEDRVARALQLPTVEASDEHGLLGNQSPEFLERAGVKGEGGEIVEESLPGVSHGKRAGTGKCFVM